MERVPAALPENVCRGGKSSPAGGVLEGRGFAGSPRFPRHEVTRRALVIELEAWRSGNGDLIRVGDRLQVRGQFELIAVVAAAPGSGVIGVLALRRQRKA